MTRRRPTARAAGAALAGCLAGAVLVSPASAVEVGPDDLDGRKAAVEAARAQTREQLDDAGADLVAAQGALDASTARLGAAQSALAAARAEEQAARAEDADLGRRLAAATAAQQEAEKRLRDSRARLAAADDVVGSLAADMYAGSQASDIADVVTADDPQAVADRMAMLDTLGSIQADAVSELGAEHAVSTAQQAHLAAARAEVDRLKKASQAAVARSAAASRTAAAAESRLTGLVAQHAADVTAVEARKTAERQRLAALDAESQRLSVLLAERAAARKAAAEKAAREKAAREKAAREKAAREEAAREQAAREQAARADAARRAAAEAARRAAAAGRRPAPAPAPAPAPPAPAPVPPAPDVPDTPPAGAGVLSRPVSAPMNSRFGRRFHPILHIWRMHTGQDYAAACGTPVHAVADGEVVMAGWSGGYGHRLVIDHGLVGGKDLASTYNHMQTLTVRSGHVSRGQLVGYSGTSGLSTGCHLHFEILADGAYVDPMRYL